MQYKIITASFDSVVYTDASATGTNTFRPFLGKTNISFAQARMGSVTIEDDDMTFGSLIPRFNADAGAPTSQYLVSDTVFGTDTKPVVAGTRMSFLQSSILVDSAGNRFYVFFPAIQDTNIDPDYPVEVGGRHTVMIIPLGVKDADGVVQWPEFRTDVLYRQSGTLGVSLGTAEVPYDMSVDDVTCFTPGTMIMTRRGETKVELLRTQDEVLTRDHGYQPIRWIGQMQLSPRRLDLQPNLRPILIEASALGPGLPEQDLIVSPQHRLLICSKTAQRMFGTDEVLVAAKHLLSLPGIHALSPTQAVSYLHILCDAHELVWSNGTWSETLFTGPQAIKAMPAAARREIFALFPALREGTHAQAARQLTSGKEGRKLAQRHLRNGRALISAK